MFKIKFSFNISVLIINLLKVSSYLFQGQVVCRLSDDWWFGWPVWWTLDESMEKRWGWDRALPPSFIARKRYDYYFLPPSLCHNRSIRVACEHLVKTDFHSFDQQALLDIYLLDNIDDAAKHAIVSLEQSCSLFCKSRDFFFSYLFAEIKSSLEMLFFTKNQMSKLLLSVFLPINHWDPSVVIFQKCVCWCLWDLEIQFSLNWSYSWWHIFQSLDQMNSSVPLSLDLIP